MKKKTFINVKERALNKKNRKKRFYIYGCDYIGSPRILIFRPVAV